MFRVDFTPDAVNDKFEEIEDRFCEIEDRIDKLMLESRELEQRITSKN